MSDKTKETLLGIERELVERGADAYRRHLDDRAVVIVPGMVLDKAETVASIESSPGWDEYDISTVGMIRMVDDAAILTYRFDGTRGSDGYAAHMSSAYTRQDDGWKLVLHQQTPIPNSGR